MATKRQLLDANILVRFFTGDPPPMAAKVRRLIELADSGVVTLVVLPVIVAETVYTLESFYEMPRKDVAKQMSKFLQSRGIEAVEASRVMDCLRRCQEHNAHFADAYLAATAVELGVPVASFDRDFNRFKDVERVEPKD